jgi:hypothetical protein
MSRKPVILAVLAICAGICISTCSKKQPEAPPPPKPKIMFAMDWFWDRLEQDIKNAKGFTVDQRGCFAFEQKTQDGQVCWSGYVVYISEEGILSDTTFGVWTGCDSRNWLKTDIQEKGKYYCHTPFIGTLYPDFGYADIKWVEKDKKLTVTVSANGTVESRVFYLFDLKRVTWKSEWNSN